MKHFVLFLSFIVLITGCSKDGLVALGPPAPDPFVPSLFFPTSVGTKWQYTYTYSYSYQIFFPEAVSRSGKHNWEIVSAKLSNDTLLLVVTSSRQDTVHQVTWVETTHAVTFDTLYYLSQVDSFPVAITRNSINVGWIQSLSTGWPPPRGDFSHGIADTLQKIALSSGMPNIYVVNSFGFAQTTYDSGRGLSLYNLSIPANHSRYETLKLVQFIPK